MPTLARLCPSCKTRTVTTPGPCSSCRRAGEIQRRAKSGDVYNSRRWRRFRAYYLGRHMLCVACEVEGRMSPATEVDHIEPLNSRNLALAFDEAACQALCKRHHSMKTARETWAR